MILETLEVTEGTNRLLVGTGNAMSFENRLEDFFGDTSDALSLNDVEADLSNMETAIQTIDEEVYVMQPPGFQGPKFPHRVYKVEKAMYGFHQAPRAWYGYTDIRSAKTPIDRENPWGKDGTGKNVELYLYRSMIESLMYLTTSRLDIMFAVCSCARHQVTPKECDLYVVKRIFRYLKGHSKLGLWYPKESFFDLVAYSDSDYGGANQDRKSTTRGCQFLGRRLISWQCKKQTIVATSTTKAEYVAAASSCGQVLWIQNQLLDYGDCYEKTLINVDHIHTDDNVADLLIKAFDVERFQYLVGGDSGNSANGLNRDPVLAFCDYNNMVAILEKTKHNTDFHQIVDFLEASHIRVETMDGETKILSNVNGRQRTVSESSIRRHLKLNDEKDEIAFPTGDARYEEAFPTVTSLDAGQDRENIAKTSAIPHEASPRVTSLGGGEGSMQQKLQELMDISTSLQRQQSLMEERVQSQDQIPQLKTRVKTLKDNEKMREGFTQEDALNTRGEGWIKGDFLVRDTVKDSDKSADKGSDSTDDMANVLGTLGAANILATGGLRSVFTTASIVVSLAVATASGSFPTAAIFTTASVATPTTRVTRYSRGVVIESSSLIYVNIPCISKKDKGKGKMTEPKQPSKEKKYQAQQNKPATKTERIDFYKLILRSNAGWKAKDFKGINFEQIEEKFIPVWEKMQDFVPMNSKLESERLKRPGIQLGKESFKKLKTAEASGTEPTQEQQYEEPKEISEEELKKMMEIVPVEELYIEALQKFDREDLDRLWSLVKETCSTTEVTDEKEKELWVELKRLYELDYKDPLWALQRYMHDTLVWRLYDTYGVHHVSTGRGHEIFLIVEKDYPLTKRLTTLMLCSKLQLDQYSEMANELLMKIYIIANSLR
nr:putative ribonuclease H-like domain-containing protein [Tanacetum cinerariifolium]